MHKTYYKGAQIFHNGNLLNGFALKVTNNYVCKIMPEEDIPSNADIKILDGGVLSAGFVETQANGGNGVLVNDDFSAEGLSHVLAGHRKFGTVAMLPTFITDTQERYHQAIQSISDCVKNNVHGIVGGHFEGPFLNPEKKGTHNKKYIRLPDEADFAIYKACAPYLQHSIISLAPECLNKGTIARLKEYVPQINLAHSMASSRDVERAYSEGLTGITHLYNAMPPMQGRDPSAIGLAQELGLYCGIIADGIHVSHSALNHAYRALGADKICLVTDSMHTIGAPQIKCFDLAGVKVFVESDHLINEFGALAGAHTTLLACVQNAVLLMQANLKDALRMAVSTPAQYIGRPDLASISHRDAGDVIYLDRNLALKEWR